MTVQLSRLDFYGPGVCGKKTFGVPWITWIHMVCQSCKHDWYSMVQYRVTGPKSSDIEVMGEPNMGCTQCGWTSRPISD